MKKLSLLFFLLLTVALSSCKKEDFDEAEQAADDDVQIQAYIKANNLTMIKDPTGLYYKIITQGTGSVPSITSTVQTNYIGTLLSDGTIFDQTTAATGSRNVYLTSAILGWQIGLPHVNAGGRIMLIVPSALGYGRTASGSIPGNSVLIFVIDVLSVRYD